MLKEEVILTPENFVDYLILGDSGTYFNYRKQDGFNVRYIKETMLRAGVEILYIGASSGSIHTLKILKNASVEKMESLKPPEPKFFNPNNLI
jgi:hypothetical protein